jgi:hypothetical protein
MALAPSGKYYHGSAAAVAFHVGFLVVSSSAAQVCLNKVASPPHPTDFFPATPTLPLPHRLRDPPLFASTSTMQPSILQIQDPPEHPVIRHWLHNLILPWDSTPSLISYLWRWLSTHPSVVCHVLHHRLCRPYFNRRSARSLHLGVCVSSAPTPPADELAVVSASNVVVLIRSRDLFVI